MLGLNKNSKQKLLDGETIEVDRKFWENWTLSLRVENNEIILSGDLNLSYPLKYPDPTSHFFNFYNRYIKKFHLTLNEEFEPIFLTGTILEGKDSASNDPASIYTAFTKSFLCR